MATRNYLRSFAGGIVSPEMFGRIDDRQFQSGAKKLTNMIVRPQGSLLRRPGFQYIAHTKNADGQRLIGFKVSESASTVLELGAGYMRFFVNGVQQAVSSLASWIVQRNVSSRAGNELTMIANHGLSPNDPVHAYVTGGDTLPGGLFEDTRYYAIVTAADKLKLAATPSGPEIPLSSDGTGTRTIARIYDEGDLVVDGGTNYYCRLSTFGVEPNPGTADATYWYPLTGNIFEIPTPWTAADLFEITYTQSFDVMTFAHADYEVMELRRFGATDWTLTALTFAPTLSAPTISSINSEPGIKVHIDNFSTVDNTAFIQSRTKHHGLATGDIVYIQGLAGGAPFDPAVFNDKYYVFERFDDDQGWLRLRDGTRTPTVPAGYTTNTGELWVTDLDDGKLDVYVVTALDELGQESRPSGAGASTNTNLLVTGSSNKITFTAVPGAVRYHVYRLENGIYGFIGKVNDDGVSGSFTFKDDGIAPDLGISPPLIDTSLDGADHPGAVGYFEGRRFFGGTNAAPQDVWGTVSNTEKDLSYHLPVQDSDRIYFRVDTRERSTVRHIVPMQHLLLLTSTSEMRVTPLNSDALTPGNVSVRPQSHVGASLVQPLVVNNTVVFESNRGGHIRELGFSVDHQGFITGDLSLRAPHMFDFRTVRDMAQMRSPLPILWAVNSAGELLGLTYSPEEGLGGWHKHSTVGTFESCCVVSEGDEDRLYVVVQRSVRTIERMQLVKWSSGGELLPAFLDGYKFGTTGLSHLNGLSVTVTNGTDVETKTVSGGAVTTTMTGNVYVGLGYTSEVETLPVTMQVDGFGQGRSKNINRLWVRITDIFPDPSLPTAMTFKAGPGDNDLVPYTPEPDSQTDPFNAVAEVVLPPAWSPDGTFKVVQTNPYPLSVASITYEVSIG